MEVNLQWNWKELHNAFFNPKQYSTISTTRGGGKTRGLALWIAEEIFEPGIESALWVDTVQSNIDSYVEEHFLKVIFKDIWKECKYNAQRKRLFLPGKRFIQFASAERRENAEGFRYHRVGLNEGGIILKKASLWDNTIEPMTHPRDGIANKTRIVGTMKGKNKFHQLRSKNDEDWSDYHFSIYDCPNYAKEEIDKIKSSVPEMVWRQEYLSEALDDAGTVFRNIDGCIKNVEGKVDVMAIDLAKHQDFTVIIFGDSHKNAVLGLDRFNQLDWSFQKSKIVNTWEKYGRPKIIIDSTGAGDPIYDDLRNAGITIEGYKFTSQTKNELIQGLSLAMDNNEISYPDLEVLINELQIFGYDMTPSGNIRYNAPSGFHDDCVIALALFNYMSKNKKSVKLTWI